MFQPVFLIVLLLFAGFGLGLLLWPSRFLQHFRNPWQPDTPENRVHIRSLGLVFCLFVLTIISSAGSTPVFEGFHRNILLALYLSFVGVPIFLWFLWQFSPLRQVARRKLTGERIEDPRWELLMSLAFSGLLSGIISVALLAAYKGHYPKW